MGAGFLAGLCVKVSCSIVLVVGLNKFAVIFIRRMILIHRSFIVLFIHCFMNCFLRIALLITLLVYSFIDSLSALLSL